DTLLGPVEEQAVVDHAHATLDVVDRVPGECPPARQGEEEADTGQRVDSDAAVAKPGDGAVQRGRVQPRGGGMDDDVGAERPPQRVVAEIHRPLEEVVDVIGAYAGGGEHAG